MELEDGCQYTGAMSKGKPNGQGKAEWKDGWIFEGEFAHGRPHRGNLRSPGIVIDASPDTSVAAHVSRIGSGAFSKEGEEITESKMINTAE